MQKTECKKICTNCKVTPIANLLQADQRYRETRNDRHQLARYTRQVKKVARVVIATAIATTLVTLVAGCASGFRPFAASSPSSTPVPTPTATPIPTPTPTPTPTFDRAGQSIDDPSSYWVVVVKLRALTPSDYVPPDRVTVPVPYVNPTMLRTVASDAVVAMFADYKAETGLGMQSQSAYRSYGTQVSVYNGWVAKLGQAGADKTSARPGHSEHQTGLAIDISAVPATCALQACFAETPQGVWLAANAWKYGFVLRYPQGKTPITGYEFEPWHYRYVGLELAAELHSTGIETLEEFFGLPAAPTY